MPKTPVPQPDDIYAVLQQQVLRAAHGDCLDLYQKLQTTAELYLQQKTMYAENTNRIPNRIVSISQSHLRPIIRGETNAPVEFGAQVATAHIGGFSFVIQLEYDSFLEAKHLEKSAEEYKRIFGLIPKQSSATEHTPQTATETIVNSVGFVFLPETRTEN